MTKQLVFDGDSKDDQIRFEYLWDGILAGGSRGEAKDRKTLRLWATIQKKLHTISEETKNPDPRVRSLAARSLKAGPQAVIFEVGQIDEILARIEKVPWVGWQEIGAADVIDFLSAAPEVKE